MSAQRERDEFISIMAKEGVPLGVTRALISAGRTLHRLAELECSSEAADRDRVPCPDTGKAVDSCLCKDYGAGEIEGTNGHGEVPRIHVKGAAVERRVSKLCKAHNLEPVFHGDPRGAVLRIKVPSGRDNGWGGVAVP